MPTYKGSRLAATGKVTSGEKRATRRALDKRIRTALSEKLIMEVEMFIPNDVTDIRTDKQRVAEVVVKLISKLKEGPLKEGKSNEQWLNGAIKFLVTDLGKAWMRSWFQPHTVENSSVFVVLTAVAGKAEAKSAVQGFVQQEGHGGLINTSDTQHLSVPISMTPLIPTSGRDGSGAMSLETTLPESQLLELSAGTASYPPTSEGSAAGMKSFQSVLDSTSIQVSTLEAAISSPSTNNFVRTLARLDPGTNQHQRSHSDPGQVHMCLICHKFHWMSNGSPHPAVFFVSEVTPTAGDVQFQQAMRNKGWAVVVMRHVLTLVNAVAWLFLCVFLVLLSKSYPRNWPVVLGLDFWRS